MTRFILFLSICFSAVTTSFSQTVIQDINFDNYINSSNNDFTNYFNGNTGLYQLQTNGITGGCLATPDSNNWGNDNAWFCAKYEGNGPFYTIYKTWISFKYDSSIYNVNGFDRMVSIWLVPSADFNHYIIASVTHDKKLQILSYSYVGTTPFPSAFQNNHWYRMQLQITMPFTTADIGFIINVFDLGLSGTSNPVSSGYIGGNLYDSILVNDPDISIGITGTRYGGALYLDNFHFEGIKGSDVCPLTAIATADLQQQLIIKQEGNLIHVKNNSAKNVLASIYDLTGKILSSEYIKPGDSEINLERFSSGLYILKCADKEQQFSTRLEVLK